MALITAEPQLFTADLDAALGYYTGRLGFTPAFAHGEPPFYAQVVRDGARLNLRLAARGALPGPRAVEPDALSATIAADDVEALFEEFERAGAAFYRPLRTEPWGARTFIVEDLDGNLILFAA